MNTTWVSLRPETEFLSFEVTVARLNDFFGSDGQNSEVPAAITEMIEQRQELAVEALGGMMFYLQSLNMANDLLSQKSFNIYDPIRKGEGMVLDGQTLSHLEVGSLGKVW
jgi:DNA mismatch repair protein MSH6